MLEIDDQLNGRNLVGQKLLVDFNFSLINIWKVIQTPINAVLAYFYTISQ